MKEKEGVKKQIDRETKLKKETNRNKKEWLTDERVNR